MILKPRPKRKVSSTGQPNRRQRNNKETPGNNPSLKPPRRPKGRLNFHLEPSLIPILLGLLLS